MKFNNRTFLLLFLMVSYSWVACKKDEERGPSEYAEESVLLPAVTEEADAVLVAIRDRVAVDITGTQDISADLVTATFGKGSFTDVGDVKLNGKLLQKTSVNKYVNVIETLDYGLLPGVQNRWVTGAGGSFPEMNRVLGVKMPAKIVLKNVPAYLSKATGGSFDIESFPANAQSVIWQIKDVKGVVVQKETTGNSVTFSPEELSALSAAENCLLKVAAYSLESTTVSDRKYVFVNETTDAVYISVL